MKSIAGPAVALSLTLGATLTLSCSTQQALSGTADETAPVQTAQTTPTSTARAKLATLTVAAEHPDENYDRDRWDHWTYVGNGCDRRDEILIASGENVQVGEDCDLTGTWTSRYDGKTFTDSSELDIDHIVPLAEAYRSGAHAWTDQRRETYANDPRVLVAVSASSNRSKGDQDPAEWKPDRRASWCVNATRWIDIKTHYDLTANSAEVEALQAMLDTCPAE